MKYLDTEHIYRRGAVRNMRTDEANRQTAGSIGANGWKRGSFVQSLCPDNSRSTSHRDNDVSHWK